MSLYDRDGFTAFLSDLYADTVGRENQLVLWTAKDKKSYWLTDIGQAGGVLEQTPPTSDLYYGTCLQRQALALAERRKRNRDPDATLAYSRGYAATAGVMPGIWLDLDIAGPGHEKRGLPASQADCDRILAALPLDPSWIIETGGGTHVYWLWREPWVLETDAERSKAAALIKGWQRAVIDAALDMGFAVDSTHDLSRVLRPIGTINTKYGKRVTFREVSDHRFNPDDFEPWGVEPVALRPPDRQKEIGDLSAEMEPPAQKLMAMLNLQPQFAATWKRERKEFPSQSEYDLSLASMAARAEWKDQEIIALVVAHRRQGGENLKLERPGYYARLLATARKGMEAEEAHDRLADRVEAVQQGDADIEDERDDFLRDVSSLLGFKIRRILKFVTDPPQYRLVLDDGQIQLGPVDTILNASKFRAAIAAVSGTLIQRFRGARWDPVAQAILQAVEELDLGTDSTVDGIVGEWLSEYLSLYRPSDNRVEAIGAKYPFRNKNGRVCFFLSEFRSWLGFHRDEKLGRKQIATLLRSAGSEPLVVNYVREVDGKKTTVNCWCVPTAVLDSLPGPAEEASAEEVPF